MHKPKINLPKEWENATSVFSMFSQKISLLSIGRQKLTIELREDTEKGLLSNYFQYF